MTSTGVLALLGRFEKARARKLIKIFKDTGIQVTVEESSVEKSKGQGQYALIVPQEELAKAVELIKTFNYEQSVLAEERRKKFERRAITFFILFGVIFIIYVVIRYH